MNIIEAGWEDIDDMVDMAREFWADTAYDDEFDIDTAFALSEHLVEKGIVLLLQDEEQNNVGMACAVIGPLLANRNVKQCSELVYYVYPEYRGEKGGFALLQALEQKADELGAKYMSMVLMHHANPEAAARLYEGMGYSLNESHYTKTL